MDKVANLLIVSFLIIGQLSHVELASVPAEFMTGIENGNKTLLEKVKFVSTSNGNETFDNVYTEKMHEETGTEHSISANASENKVPHKHESNLDDGSVDVNSTTERLVKMITVSSKPLQILEDVLGKQNNSEVMAPVNNNTKFDYKDKIRPSFQLYLDETLKSANTERNETSSPVSTIMKSEGYQSPQNYLSEEFPSFREQDLYKRRLNHWRVKQMLKGVDEGKMGQVGIKEDFSYLFGQKTAHVKEKSTSTAQLVQPIDTQSLKLKTFFNWFSDSLKMKSGDNSRVQQVNAQLGVLPFALSYRGDFLFW